MASDRGIFTLSKTVDGGNNEVIEIGHLRNVVVQGTRTGSTDTLTLEVSNDNTNWLTATGKKDSGSGQAALSTLTDFLEELAEHARYLRLNPSGATDSWAVEIIAQFARN